MQISDLVGQYSRNVANGTEELHGAQSVQKLVSTIGDLSAGSIFEGTINSVRGGKVTLALGNGQTITARLDGKMDLQQGSSMFFQVRANDGRRLRSARTPSLEMSAIRFCSTRFRRRRCLRRTGRL